MATNEDDDYEEVPPTVSRSGRILKKRGTTATTERRTKPRYKPLPSLGNRLTTSFPPLAGLEQHLPHVADDNAMIEQTAESLLRLAVDQAFNGGNKLPATGMVGAVSLRKGMALEHSQQMQAVSTSNNNTADQLARTVAELRTQRDDARAECSRVSQAAATVGAQVVDEQKHRADAERQYEDLLIRYATLEQSWRDSDPGGVDSGAAANECNRLQVAVALTDGAVGMPQGVQAGQAAPAEDGELTLSNLLPVEKDIARNLSTAIFHISGSNWAVHFKNVDLELALKCCVGNAHGKFKAMCIDRQKMVLSVTRLLLRRSYTAIYIAANKAVGADAARDAEYVMVKNNALLSDDMFRSAATILLKKTLEELTLMQTAIVLTWVHKKGKNKIQQTYLAIVACIIATPGLVLPASVTVARGVTAAALWEQEKTDVMRRLSEQSGSSNGRGAAGGGW